VIGTDDDWSQGVVTEMTAHHPVKLIPISARRTLGRGVYALNGVIYDATGERAVQVIDLKAVRTLTGRHNWQNACAAYSACKALGLSVAAIVAGIRSFPGLDHRMQEIGRIKNVRFINDSKATNADAARQAMSSFERFYWIAGGRAKAGGIEDLKDLFPRVKHAYLIGEAAALFEKTIGAAAPCTQSRLLFTAVAQAFAAAEVSGKEEIVLLSPACASQDQFTDFEARGDAFKEAVADLQRGLASAG